MGSRWRNLVERFLPWYNPSIEKVRDARSERRSRRSVKAHEQAERVIAEYRRAEGVSDKAGEALIDEVRRADK